MREYILTFSVPISKIASLLMSSGVNDSYAILLFFQGMLLPLVRVLIVEQQRDSSLSVTKLYSHKGRNAESGYSKGCKMKIA